MRHERLYLHLVQALTEGQKLRRYILVIFETAQNIANIRQFTDIHFLFRCQQLL